MLLSRETKISFKENEANIINHMCYAAYKLWNICNYERHHYKELIQKGELEDYPDWYYQKSAHKDNMWFKSLPSQTAQEVCKQLDKGWKSFYALQKSGGIENPNPPKYKHEVMPITYMQNGIQQIDGCIRLSLPKQLRNHMFNAYGIKDKYIFIHNKFMNSFNNIKQIKIYPVENGISRIIIIYEVEDIPLLADNFHYLSIDLGLHNLFTCYDSLNGSSFIVGRKYLSICRKYDKEIGRVQSEWHSIQNAINNKKAKPVADFHPKSYSKHIVNLYEKKHYCVKDYLHKVTKNIVDYCVKNNIHTVVIGDLTGIRKDNNKGNITNQKLHGLPYAQIYTMLEYKLNKHGISLIFQEEFYTSQCSPNSPKVSKRYGKKNNRVYRGLYKDGTESWNADSVGAYNILRLSSQKNKTSFISNKIEIPIVWKISI